MNKLIAKLPARARRHTLLLHSPAKDKLYHLFSIIEVLEPDMQDYDMPDPVEDSKASDNITSKSNEYNIYYHIETFELVEESLLQITSPYTIGKDTVCFMSANYGVEPPDDVFFVTDRNHTGVNLSLLFPKRVGPYYIKTYVEKERQIERLVNENKNLQRQLSELSQKYFHVDFTRSPEHIGNVYLAWHHHSLKDIDLTASENPNGVMVNSMWRYGKEEPININIVLHRQGTIATGLVTKQIEAGRRKIFIPLPEYPKLMDFYVSDKDDSLLMSMEHVTFIRHFNISTGLMEERAVPKIDKDGKVIGHRTVSKYINESFNVGKTVPSLSDYFRNAAELNAWEQEMKKEAVYIEHGDDEQGAVESIKKAKATIREIINMAQRECYVCDIFFGASDVNEFLSDVQDLGVDVRILSSKETGNKEKAKALKKSIDGLNDAIGRNQMRCRVLRGDDAPLHDRFIISDDKVWSVGTSLNQIGTKSTFIARVNTAVAKKIKTEVEKWWNSDKFSEALEDYVKD